MQRSWLCWSLLDKNFHPQVHLWLIRRSKMLITHLLNLTTSAIAIAHILCFEMKGQPAK